MEFAHIGKHCDIKSCKQYDFLPTTCRLCHKVLCPTHSTYEAHQCAEAYRLENIPIKCPICTHLLVVPKQHSPDYIVEAHIASGCQTHIDPTDMYQATKKKKNKRTCQFGDSCSYNRMVKCKFCKKKFCHLHRYTDQHNCPKAIDESPPTPVLAQATGSGSMNPFLAKALNAMGMKPEDYLMKRGARKANTFMGDDNHTPYGQSSIEKADRFHMYVYFPRRFQAKQPHNPAVKMYFHKKWSIGKVMDKICSFGALPNRNHDLKPEEMDKRLSILSLAALTDGPIPIRMTLEELESANKLKNGWFRLHGLIVEFGKDIPHLYQKFGYAA